MNKRRGFSIWPVVVLILMIAYMLYTTIQRGNTGNYSYTQFVRDLEAGTAISQVVIEPNQELPSGTIYAMKDGKQYSFYTADVGRVEQEMLDHGYTNYTTTDVVRPSWIEQNIVYLIMAGALIFFLFFFISGQQNAGGNKVMNFGKSRAV